MGRYARYSTLFLSQALLLSSVAAQSWAPVTKRTPLLRGRHTAREDLAPKSEVTVSYGEIGSSDVLYTSDFKLLAHEGEAYVLLEEIEHLTASISCSQDEVEILFTEIEHLDLIESSWAHSIIITSHASSGCNEASERAPKRVKHLECNRDSSSVRLSTEPLTWESSARKMSAVLGHAKVDDFHRDLVRRDLFGDEDDDNVETAEVDDNADMNSTTLSLTTDLDPRVELYPLSANGTDLSDFVQLPDLNIACLGCSLAGKVLLSGGWDLDFNITDAVTVDTAFIELEVTEDILATVEVEVAIPAAFKQKFAPSLLPQPIGLPFLMLPIAGVTIGPQLDLAAVLSFAVDVGNVNFTYGLDATLPAGAIARLDFADENATASQGWDKLTVKEKPLTLNAIDGDVVMALNLTAQPSLSVGISLGGPFDVFDAKAGLSLSIPTLYSSLTYMQNVTENCEAAAADAIEYFSDALAFDAGLEVAVTAFAEFKGAAIPDRLEQSWSKTLWSTDLGSLIPDVPKRCFTFDSEALGEVSLASDSNPDFNLESLESAVEGNDGALPTGINPTQLASYTATAGLAVPTAVGEAVEEAAAGRTENARWAMGLAIIGAIALV